MILIACVDDGMGLAFNCRRQSRDRLLVQRLLTHVGDAPLWTHPYSAKQFEQTQSNIIPSEGFLALVGENEFAFTELEDPGDFTDRVERIILYRWNRTYPSDVRFTLALSDYTLVQTTEFAGHSHEKITEEIYEK